MDQKNMENNEKMTITWKKIYYTIKPILDILQQQNELTKSLCSWAILAFFKNRLTF